MTMKKFVFSLIATMLVLCQLFTTAAVAAQSVAFPDEGMTLQLPDDFSVVTKENLTEKAELLQEYNVSQTETDIKFHEENYLLLGLSQTMRCTMFLSKQTDAVSLTVGDLISYENPDVARSLILGKELPESVTVKEIERNGALSGGFRCDRRHWPYCLHHRHERHRLYPLRNRQQWHLDRQH